MSRLWVLLAAAALDWLLGDPAWMPHPIRLMGWTISRLETGLRRLFPRTPGGELLAGGVLVLTMVLLFGGGACCSWPLYMPSLRRRGLRRRSGSAISCWPPGASGMRVWRCIGP